MPWQRSRGGRYYVRKLYRRADGRVVRWYIGTGPAAEAAAQADQAERARRAAAAEALRIQRVRLTALEVTAAEFCAAVEALAVESLYKAGYHRHKRGEWRKKRGQHG